ncbi:Unknown protein sequence [Pseudomonas savastanoi pv. phaseolicola]|uniref:Oxidoreductase, Gfo/Idh/MocA protein n=2 Tax=Pseudomonas savastanoi TaxID=29438 RepID=A0A3M3G1N5_PSESG|nr:Unknown protein sequence [Pseudomonas savastanoi pv. phaseolicola]KPB62265.1 Unknown protein sequence [Pseudomonas amygdali pv. mellea]RMM67162.1 Oxidoreductase, Gfo/Idh/MocA protein [Pseudomonas savastanoi pv. glycinea]KPB48494.1 Unknown protein sequence [Pseudomonas savastanoi pv. phaseolicola]KPB53809.1 Unknown protein sequence [Pseudomonas savastanoi pv. phaseolicola]
MRENPSTSLAQLGIGLIGTGFMGRATPWPSAMPMPPLICRHAFD